MEAPAVFVLSSVFLGVPVLGFMGLGTVELLVVSGVILLLFGSRLPKVMRSLGQGIVEFKRGVQGIEDESNQDATAK
ncbi:MAG: twin-arginine translocase TatA/TatE family subunit [Pirellulales bacterium]|jgi:sec-independent protein translocase protein TatA|nr:twin-arginine translocase TatA/TatE family subunit [Pirellulales bacterium]